MRAHLRPIAGLLIALALVLGTTSASSGQGATVQDDPRDIVSATVAHRTQAIAVKVVTQYSYTTLTVVVEARRAGVVRRYRAFVFDETSGWKVIGPAGGIRCTAAQRDAYGASTVTIRGSFPRRCFGSPGAIRFRVVSEGDPGLDQGVLDRTAWSRWLRPS